MAGGSGVGMGGGASARPVAVVVIGPDGVEVKPVFDARRDAVDAGADAESGQRLRGCQSFCSGALPLLDQVVQLIFQRRRRQRAGFDSFPAFGFDLPESLDRA